MVYLDDLGGGGGGLHLVSDVLLILLALSVPESVGVRFPSITSMSLISKSLVSKNGGIELPPNIKSGEDFEGDAVLNPSGLPTTLSIVWKLDKDTLCKLFADLIGGISKSSSSLFSSKVFVLFFNPLSL